MVYKGRLDLESKLEARQQLPLPWIAAQTGVVVERRSIAEGLRVDVPETGRRHSRIASRRRGQGIGGNRICHVGAIEYVEELDTDLERHPFANAEQAANAELLRWMPLV